MRDNLRTSLRTGLGILLCLGSAGLAAASWRAAFAPQAFGGSDVNLITGTETSPQVTQAMSVIWGHNNTVVAAYNDSRGLSGNFCGVSVSTDGGNTFARLDNFPGAQCGGEPALFYSRRASKWVLHFLTTRCASFGVGKWSSSNGSNWSYDSCAANANLAASRLSSWVDNNEASPFYGRQYLFFNDSGAARFSYSTDDGVTWSTPVTIGLGNRLAIKVTGSLGSDGAIFLQTLHEGGSGLNALRTNSIYRSTDGGVSFSAAVQQGPAFLGPGRGLAGSAPFSPGMYNLPVAGYWRDLGWGQPGVGPNNVVHYVYSGRTTSPADPGNIFYVRSTDNGQTWAAPVRLNTDDTTRAQWSPSLSVNAAGVVFISWYDERNTLDDSLERFGRASFDNGATWGADMPVSDQIFPKPLQSTPTINPTFAGFFNHASFSDDGFGPVAYHTWTDGRVAINGTPQQDVFFDKITPALANYPVKAGSSIVTAGANGVPDPSEPITVSLGIMNRGDAGQCTTSALTATLLTTGGVTAPVAASQNYGAICSGGPAVFRNFTFKVDPALACGDVLTASLVLTDGLTNHGTRTFTFDTGGRVVTLAENFDTVTAPALPANWTASNAVGSAPLWQTSTTAPATAPNALFVDAPATASDKWIETPPVALDFRASEIRFRQSYDTEGGYDGGVLEVSSQFVNDGAFTDITAPEAGASFVQGGYTSILTAGSGNPIAGRKGWAGHSGGYIDTVVNLGNILRSHTVKFRFRMTTDNGSAGTGWWIDNFSVARIPCAPVPTAAFSRKTHGSAGTFDVPLPLAGSLGVEPRSTSGAHQIVVDFLSFYTVGGASVTSGTGTVTSSFPVTATRIAVDLTGVTNAQRLTLTLTNVSNGSFTGDVAIPIGFLVGDVNGNGSVNSVDISQVKSQSGQPVTNTNFRLDITPGGAINSGDVGLIKSFSGSILP